jgi:protein-S-isoprenylcysteine O-methyltransferase Ste14
MTLKNLMGSGDKIMLLTLPFLIVGLALNIAFPSFFAVGGPPAAVAAMSVILLVPGIVVWLWSVVLILTEIPKKKLITGGPYALVKHPLYTSVGLLVLPCTGILLNSWLGVAVGIVLYTGSRLFSHEEEEKLAKEYGAAWDAYVRKVKMPWL